MRCVELLHLAGIPETVLQFFTGKRQSDRATLIADPRVAGVAFTGSTETAQFINRQLAQHHQAIVPLIAETGGQNVMIADSSALLEQLVQDVIVSAFNSAGQRCSALRVLLCSRKSLENHSHADRRHAGISHGRSRCYHTDIGPVIDQAA